MLQAYRYLHLVQDIIDRPVTIDARQLQRDPRVVNRVERLVDIRERPRRDAPEDAILAEFLASFEQAL